MAAMNRGAKVLYCVYLALLMGFTGFVTLDTFVIARGETTLEAPQRTQTPSVASAEPTITENRYQGAQMCIFPFKLIPGGWTIRPSILLM